MEWSGGEVSRRRGDVRLIGTYCFLAAVPVVKPVEVFDVSKILTRSNIVDVPLNVVAGKGNLVVIFLFLLYISLFCFVLFCFILFMCT